MLEILLCSLVTIVPGLSLPPLLPGKTDRQGNHPLLRVVRAEVGDHGLPGSRRRPDHGDLLQPPVHHQRHAVLRTIPIISETTGRVAEVFVGFSGTVEKGAPIFRLDSSTQEAAVETARRRIAEVEADMEVAQADILKAEGQLQEAQGSSPAGFGRAGDQEELQKTQSGHRRAARDREASSFVVEGRMGGIASATAAGQTVKAGSRRFSRRKRPAPKRRSPRPRWNWTKTLSAPASADAWSNSRCAWAISSLRSCVRPGS